MDAAIYWVSGTFVSLLFYQFIGVCSIEIDNTVLGYPSVLCEIDSVNVLFETRKQFNGKAYVKGHSTVEKCSRDFSNSSLYREQYSNIENNNSLSIKYGTCNIQRDRSINPRGVFLRTTIVIQFHTVFTTKVDKAYRISCFYQESIRTVNAQVDVSMLLTTSLLHDGFSMPLCDYSIRKDKFDGPLVHFVNVGDNVVHRWECRPPAGYQNNYPYGMLVHSCYVNDGNKNSELVVDDKGCSLDPYILDHLFYNDDLLVAYKDAQAFKFADQNLIRFSCQIKLCIKTMDSCRGMTPPKCLPLKNKRNVAQDFNKTLEFNGNLSNSNNVSTNLAEDLDNIDVHSDTIFVFDKASDSEKFSLEKIETPLQDDNFFCISVLMSLTLALITVLICCCLFFGIFVIAKRHHTSFVAQTTLLQNDCKNTA